MILHAVHGRGRQGSRDRIQSARRATAGAVMTALVVALGLCASPIARAVTHDEVQAAIAKGKAYLYNLQRSGNWEMVNAALTDDSERAGPAAVTGGQWGGLTALATYSLLAAGENPQDPRIKRAVEWLAKADIRGTYALALRAQVWTYFDAKIVAVPANRDLRLLMNATQASGDAAGLYDYLPSGGGRYDHSVSQYGVLGTWALSEMKCEVPARYWQAVEGSWTRHQAPNGGWSYDQTTPVSASMTAAGVATLFICQDMLHGFEGADCKGNPRSPHIEAGIKWLADNFGQVADNYTWYGVERIGVASGHKYFGAVDWYHAGAEALVGPREKSQSGQSPDGSWQGNWGGPVVNTAFALLFLSRGRSAVIMNKLDYQLDAGDRIRQPNWNQRPRDAANFVKWLMKEQEQFYNWQIVNLEAPVEELHDAPLLYVAGNQPLNFTKQQLDKLRAYVEEGGLIVCNVDCKGKPFLDSIVKADDKQSLGRQLFPDYKFQKLTTKDPLYTFVYDAGKWKDVPEVQALGNGARTFIVVFSGGDPARHWQTRTLAGHEGAYQLMGNIFMYATDKLGARLKDDTYLVRRDPDVQAAQKMKVARLAFNDHCGDWDPEPGGWRRLANVMHNEARVDVEVAPVKLGDGSLLRDKPHVAHLTSTVAYALSNEQVEELRKFVGGGGLLVIDACGGAAPARQSGEALVAALGLGELKPVKPSAVPFHVQGNEIEAVSYRKYAQGILRERLREPRLKSVNIGERPAVFFSAEDLSVGLVGQNVGGVNGYTPESATAIMRNILLTAAGPVPGPAPAKP